jgi:hypothetical protein
VKLLYILDQEWNSRNTPSSQDDIQVETGQWLEVLHPLTAVKDLYISQGFAPRIALTLQELVGGRVAEVLPALQTLHPGVTLPSGPVQESIGKFVAARQLAGCPVTVSQGTPASAIHVLPTSERLLLVKADALLREASLKVHESQSALSPAKYDMAQSLLE